MAYRLRSRNLVPNVERTVVSLNFKQLKKKVIHILDFHLFCCVLISADWQIFWLITLKLDLSGEKLQHWQVEVSLLYLQPKVSDIVSLLHITM